MLVLVVVDEALPETVRALLDRSDGGRKAPVEVAATRKFHIVRHIMRVAIGIGGSGDTRLVRRLLHLEHQRLVTLHAVAHIGVLGKHNLEQV